MKPFRSIPASLLIASLVLTISSCKNGAEFGNDADSNIHPSAVSSVSAMMATNNHANSSASIPQIICSEKTVNLCSGSGALGTVTVKRGSDNRIYVTYSSQANWYLAQLNVYMGAEPGIPPYLVNFPLKKTFAYPLSVQEYSFAQDHLPATISIVAYAILVKKVNGKILSSRVAWADGCSGLDIDVCGNLATHPQKSECSHANNCHTDLDGGSYFNYTSESCNMQLATAVEPDICSMTVPSFFWTDPANPDMLTWRTRVVTVAGFSYTELEAKTIGSTADGNGGIRDSKYCFMRLATLKLSGTDYSLSPTLAPAVSIIEKWLAATGKLSPMNLPSGNASVRAAAEAVNTWIDTHNCTIEE